MPPAHPARSSRPAALGLATNGHGARLFGQAERQGRTMNNFLIGALVIAVAVLGYLYWDSRENTVLKAPGVEIKKN
jgi:hypothetical protein